MRKTQAIELLGGTVTAAAGAVGITYQAVNQWPDLLPDRIADRVLGACIRLGVEIPAEFIKPGLVDRRETVRRTDDISKDAELQALKADKGAAHE